MSALNTPTSSVKKSLSTKAPAVNIDLCLYGSERTFRFTDPEFEYSHASLSSSSALLDLHSSVDTGSHSGGDSAERQTEANAVFDSWLEPEEEKGESDKPPQEAIKEEPKAPEANKRAIESKEKGLDTLSAVTSQNESEEAKTVSKRKSWGDRVKTAHKLSDSAELELDELRRSQIVVESSDEEEEDDDDGPSDVVQSQAVGGRVEKSGDETVAGPPTENGGEKEKEAGESVTPPTSPQPSSAPPRPAKPVGPDDSMIYDINDIGSLSSSQKIESHSRKVMKEKVQDSLAELEQSMGDGLENRWAMRERANPERASIGTVTSSLASVEEDRSMNLSMGASMSFGHKSLHIEEVPKRQKFHVIDIQELRRLSSQGISDLGSHRAVAWRVLLGYLPPDTSQWQAVLKRDRNLYRNLVSELFVQPSHQDRKGRNIKLVESEGRRLRGRGMEKDGVSVRDMRSLIQGNGVTQDATQDKKNVLVTEGSLDGLGVEVEHVVGDTNDASGDIEDKDLARRNGNENDFENAVEEGAPSRNSVTDSATRSSIVSTGRSSICTDDGEMIAATAAQFQESRSSFVGNTPFEFEEEEVENVTKLGGKEAANHQQKFTRTASDWAKERQETETKKKSAPVSGPETKENGIESAPERASAKARALYADVKGGGTPSGVEKEGGGRPNLEKRASARARDLYVNAKGPLTDVAERRRLTSNARPANLIGKDAPVPVHTPELHDGIAGLVPARVREQWKKSGREATALAGISSASGGTGHMNALLVVDDNGYTPDGSRKQRVTVNDDPLSLESDSKWAQFFENASLLDEIRKDVVRTHPDLHFFLEPEDNLGQRRYAALERILFVWAKLNKGVRYVQGMNEIVGTIYFVLANDANEDWACEAEADAYFLFNTLMVEMRDVFVPDLDDADTGIQGRISNMMALLSLHDPEVRCHLDDCGIDASFYAIRWLTTLLSREFLLPDTIRLWDSMFASTHKDNFMRYVCVTMVMVIRYDLLKGDFSACLRLLQSYPPTNIDRLLESSRALWIYESQVTLACHKGGISLQQALSTIAPPPAIIMAYGLPGGVALQRGDRVRQASEKGIAAAKEASNTVATAGKSFFGSAKGLWGEWRSNSEKRKEFRRGKTM